MTSRPLLTCSFLLLAASASAQNATSQPTSQPASQPTSRPSLPPPETVAPTEPLVGWTPPTFQEPESQPTEEPVNILPPEPPPGPAAQIGNAAFAAGGLGFIGAATGSLIGLLSVTQLGGGEFDDAREELGLGFELGTAAGAGFGVIMSGRSNQRPGSKLGAFVGSFLATSAAVAIAFPATDIVNQGIDEAEGKISFFFVLPYVASVGGAVLGYELFPRKKSSALALE